MTAHRQDAEINSFGAVVGLRDSYMTEFGKICSKLCYVFYTNSISELPDVFFCLIEISIIV